MPNWPQVIQHLQHVTAKQYIEDSAQMVFGGDINRSYVLSTAANEKIFVKFNEVNRLDMFQAEADGLHELAQANCIKAPEVITVAANNQESYLALEYLSLSKNRNETLFGQQLAAMHQVTRDDFGWFRHNTIGVTQQFNTPTQTWSEFWIQYRLTPQLKIAQRNQAGKHLLDCGEKLIDKTPALFAGHQVKAALLHGDLWGGNAAGLADGTPVIFDPAVYYGDREVDLAMMELFGGFSKDCYDAYHEAYPIDKQGYGLRKMFYNLYHLLNHFNLFGSGYQQRCIDVMEKLNAEI